MCARFNVIILILCLAALLFHARTAFCEDAKPSSSPRQAVERGLKFLIDDAAKWKQERQCSTCHHGTMTVWALSEANSNGFPVDGKSLEDIVKWTKERFMPNLDKPRDPRPGWNLVSTPALYLAVMSQSLPELISNDERIRIADHVARHQEDDGAWLMPFPKNGPPPVWETREVFTLLAYLAMDAPVSADSRQASTIHESRKRAASWLKSVAHGDSTQAIALRLLQPDIDLLLSKQNSDGGWNQDKDLPNDAFATGQALYFLSLAGVKKDSAEIRRGVAFLASQQKEDGSWPMTSRAHPGEKPFTNPMPITHIGTAWAIIGMSRSLSGE